MSACAGHDESPVDAPIASLLHSNPAFPPPGNTHFCAQTIMSRECVRSLRQKKE
jgi:hypothetical protein